MCTESKDNKVKFIVATVKPNDSESAVLEAMENQYGQSDFVLQLNINDSLSKMYMYSCSKSEYILLNKDTLNYSKYIRVEDLKNMLYRCCIFNIVTNSLGETICDLIDELPYKYILEE